MLDLLKKIWHLWKSFVDKVLELAFQLLLLIFYFTILIPFAFIFKISDKETFVSGWFKATDSKGEDLY